MFGGNSNWRGPIWFPLNFLVAAALQRYHRFFGDDHTIEYPTGSGQRLSLDAVAHDLWQRIVSIFLAGSDGRRPCFGGVERLTTRPTVAGQPRVLRVLPRRQRRRARGRHQTGWTGVIADIIRRRHGEVSSIGDLLRELRDTEADQ